MAFFAVSWRSFRTFDTLVPPVLFCSFRGDRSFIALPVAGLPFLAFFMTLSPEGVSSAVSDLVTTPAAEDVADLFVSKLEIGDLAALWRFAGGTLRRAALSGLGRLRWFHGVISVVFEEQWVIGE
jgi:hypothetical protein